MSYKLLWQDLFDQGKTLNPNIWNIEMGGTGLAIMNISFILIKKKIFYQRSNASYCSPYRRLSNKKLHFSKNYN